MVKTRSLAWQIKTFFSSPSLRCACSEGADKHGRSDLSHAAIARHSAPSAFRLQPALLHLLPNRFLCQTAASSTPQCLLQWNDRPSAPLLQPGETGNRIGLHSLIQGHTVSQKTLLHFGFLCLTSLYMIFILFFSALSFLLPS